MTKDDIIRMAREAGISIRGHYDETGPTPQELKRFAALLLAAEREAIAKMFDGKVWAYDYREIAAAIRARGSDAA